jgi:hypothetical protein
MFTWKSLQGKLRRGRSFRYRPVLMILEDRTLLSFIAGRSFAAGAGPTSVAVGDFNGDGIPDLAVANFYSANVSVLLGNGDGSFQDARNFAAGLYPGSVAVADVNDDGLLDLVVANGSINNVSVLLGNGDGTFQAARNFAAGADPDAVAVGDFNGDGLPDLAVADSGGSSGYGQGVSVLLGNGDGSFQAARTFAAGSLPISVAVADVNGDGLPDLVVANERSNNVSVLLGNGDGSFQAAQSFAAGTDPTSVAVGDFNGDGHPDLAVANVLSNTVSVLLGNGDGSFQAAQSFAAGTDPESVAVGDFSGDGIPDLAVADFGDLLGNGAGVSVLLGNGDGSFQAAKSFAAGTYPVSVAVGDFNGDGLPDLVTTNVGTSLPDQGTVSVLLGNGDGSFQAAPRFATGTRPRSVAVGDFNGDGIPDLAVANAPSGQLGTVSVLLGNGDGSFQPARSFSVGYYPDAVAVGDFDGNGDLDLAVANYGSNTVSVLLGNGDGSFQAAQSFAAGSGPESVAVGDFNGDGLLDLAVANGLSAHVSVLLGNGDGSFQPAVSYATGLTPASVAVGDFNGDGIPDLAIANYGNSTVSVLLGDGDGSFQAAQSFAAGFSPSSVAVGDFNGDGIPDLAVANNPSLVSGTVSVLLGNGDGSFQAARSFAAGTSPQSVAVGDFNGDGLLDLAVAGSSGVRVLLGNGDGSFQTTNFSFVAGGAPVSVAVADVNGDAFPDLAVANNGSNDVSILLNDGVWPARPAGGSGREDGGLRRGGTAQNSAAEPLTVNLAFVGEASSTTPRPVPAAADVAPVPPPGAALFQEGIGLPSAKSSPPWSSRPRLPFPKPGAGAGYGLATEPGRVDDPLADGWVS